MHIFKVGSFSNTITTYQAWNPAGWAWPSYVAYTRDNGGAAGNFLTLILFLAVNRRPLRSRDKLLYAWIRANVVESWINARATFVCSVRSLRNALMTRNWNHRYGSMNSWTWIPRKFYFLKIIFIRFLFLRVLIILESVIFFFLFFFLPSRNSKYIPSFEIFFT